MLKVLSMLFSLSSATFFRRYWLKGHELELCGIYRIDDDKSRHMEQQDLSLFV
jgi:hypothetical protein